MKKRLSIFFFEGILLNYPNDVERESWLSDPRGLYYPYVSDLPGHSAWDQFACGFYKKAWEDIECDVILMSGIEGRDKNIDSRIKLLMKFPKLATGEIMRKKPGEDFYSFCKSNLSYYLSCSRGTSQSYEEINLYFEDLEISKDIADYIISEFSITTIVHDLYSS